MSVAIFDNVYDFLTQSRAHHTIFLEKSCDEPARLCSSRVQTSKMNKFDASALRYRQHTLDLKASRSRTVFIPDYTPPASVGLVTAAAAKKKAAGPVAAKGPTCTARTLEGRQCTFRVVAGGCFCKKHSTMV